MPNLALAQHDLVAWLSGPVGEAVFRHEALVCAEEAFKVLGYRAVQLGISPGHSLLVNLSQQHKFVLAPLQDRSASCVCDYAAMPLPSNTIDVVLLHHALEFSPNPHQLLNEVARVVTAGGHLIIVVFNPFSLFGLFKWGAALTKRTVWRHHSLRMARLTDWLQLLGFQITATRRGWRGRRVCAKGSSGVTRRARLYARLGSWIGADAFYVIIARKQVAPLSLLRPAHWPSVKVPAFGGLKSVGTSDRQQTNGL